MANRRDFLATSTLLGFGTSVPAFLGHAAWAAPAVGTRGAKETVLVVVQLTGGNDGLNTVIPFADPGYKKLRPTIGIASDSVKKLDKHVGLHPAMADLAGLHENGQLCTVQAVGYPNPSQSHFRSMDIWQAASTRAELTEGWLGQALKQRAMPGFHLASGGNDTAPLALAGAPARVPSITSLEDFQLKTTASDSSDKKRQQQLIAGVSQGTPSGTGTLLDFVKRTATNTYDSSARLREIGKNYQPKSPYPNTGLANRLKLAAQLIDTGVGARIFYVAIDGFDTHAGQGGVTGAHANLLRDVSGAIAAFVKDVSARGHGKRVCVMTFSEFGRRARENGSAGTDHGSAAPLFLAGGAVRPGVLGEHPSLTQLDAGNLRFTVDFRRVYAAVLQNWLGVEAEPILGPGFEPLDVFVKT